MKITTNELMADLTRAIRECFPDRAEELIRQLEIRMRRICLTCRRQSYRSEDEEKCSICVYDANMAEYNARRDEINEGVRRIAALRNFKLSDE